VRTVTFDPHGGPLAVELVVGGGKPGAYRVFLWNAEHTKQRGVAAGITIDATPSRFAVPVAAARAAGRVLEWNVVVDKPLRGGRLRYQGELDGMEVALVGLVTFVAKTVK